MKRLITIGAAALAAAFAALPPFVALAEGADGVPAASFPVRRSEAQQSELIAEWNTARARQVEVRRTFDPTRPCRRAANLRGYVPRLLG